jgi:hypothetical protein
MRTEDSFTRNQSWQASLDQRLIKRITRPLIQPGTIERQLPRRLFERTQQMTGRLPLLTGLLQRWRPAGDLRIGASQQTFLGPGPRRSAQGKFQPRQPFAMDSEGLAVKTGVLTGPPAAETVQRSQIKGGGQRPVIKPVRKQALDSRQESPRSPDESQPTAGITQQPPGIQRHNDKLPGRNHHRGNTGLQIADNPAEPINRSQTISLPSKSVGEGAAVKPLPADYNRRSANSKPPVFFKGSVPQPQFAFNDPPGSRRAPKPTTGTGQPPTQPRGRLTGAAGISSSVTLGQKHDAGRPAQQVAAQKGALAPPEMPDSARVVVSPLPTNRQHISNTGGQLFLKRSGQQPPAFSGDSGRSMKKGQDPTTSIPRKTGTQGAVDTAILNVKPGLSMVQHQRAVNGEAAATVTIPIHRQPIAKSKPKAITGSGIGMIWRKGGNDSYPDNPLSANIKAAPQALPALNSGPTGEPMLFRAAARIPAERARVEPGPEESIESTRSPAETGRNEAAGIDLTKIAQQVSRLISRKLSIGLERRGIGRWP